MANILAAHKLTLYEKPIMTGHDLYRDVLIPTDGSTAASVAVDHALSVASANNAGVHAMYVVDVRILMAADDDSRDHLIEDLRNQGRNAVDEIAKKAAEAGLEATTAVTRGTPWKKILEYSDDADIDLIVIATTGKTPREKRMGLGSVSERVVDDATIPVLVVPGEN